LISWTRRYLISLFLKQPTLLVGIKAIEASSGENDHAQQSYVLEAECGRARKAVTSPFTVVICR